MSSNLFQFESLWMPTAQSDTRSFHELAPLIPLSEWWHLAALAAGFVAICWLVLAVYRRDSQTLARPVAVLLMSLRILAFVGLVFFVLGLERRSETRMVKPSELSVLVDVSLSMGLADIQPTSAGSESLPSVRRIDAVIEMLGESPLLDELNRNHELTIYRFGDTPQLEEIATWEKTTPTSKSGAMEGIDDDRLAASLAVSLRWGQFAVATLLVGISLIALATFASIFGSRLHLATGYRSLPLAFGCILLVVGTAFLAATDLSSSEFDLWTSLGWQSPDATVDDSTDAQKPNSPALAIPQYRLRDVVDWNGQLSPRATSTRLGQALQQVIDKKRGGAAAGILLITDGRNNAGPPPSRAIAAASDANIPVYVLGVGSDRRARNVRISELQAPPRVFPGDKFQVKAILQSYAMGGQSVRVQLFSVDEEESEVETIEDDKTIQLVDDGQPLNVDFTVAHQQQGRRRYIVRLLPPPGDLDSVDNERSTTVEIILRKTKILLIAGGPMRDYQFLRNQLYRDKDVTLDVWLQMAKPGSDQESDKLLFEFPPTADELFEYDCIVAFDPDWRRLSTEQSRWLERWISEKAGGMIVIAGPVFTPEWTRQPRGEEAIDLIRRLYPVSFYSQGTANLKLGRFGGEKPFPLEFTREGRAAEHLWLADSMGESAANWNRFGGVYGYYAVNEPKAGADVLAHFSDPTTSIDGQMPIYLASHFYGAGRVFFQASGEIWRLREVDVEFFQRYYLSLIRWVSQGRLLRDSNRGVLLVERNRCWVGDQIVVRAILRDESDAPFMASQVNAVLKRPNGLTETIEMRNIQDAARPGTFSGQFVATLEGDHQIRLPLPHSPQLRELTADVQASIPDLEKERPQRNDALLSEIAEKTGGRYFASVERSVLESAELPAAIAAVDQEIFLPGTPDELFNKKIMAWLVAWLTLVFAIEWTIRRLHKLA